MPLFEIMFLLLFIVFPLLTVLSSIIGGIKLKRTYIMPLITFGTFFLLLSLVTRNITEIKEGLMWVLLYTVISLVIVIVTKIIIKKTINC